jgi:DNA-binding NarL/FixJ family response regulator
VFDLIVTAEDKHMLSANNSDYHYTEREKNVLELYKNGKNTRDIAKEQRMSLRDISIILRNSQLIHGTAMTKDNENDNNKSPH